MTFFIIGNDIPAFFKLNYLSFLEYPPTTEYRFKCSDPAAELIAVINGKEYRIPGGGEYVIKI